MALPQSAASNFPGGFNNVTIRGIPLTQSHPGQVFWVSNATTVLPGQVGGSNSNPGTFNAPCSTIAGALAKCTANRGDIIFVKPGHAETIADAATLLMNVAGVAIIGLGRGSKRPTLTFTAAAANIPLVAADMAIQNILFVANFADVASVFTATSTNTPTDLVIESCEFRDTSSILNFISIVTGNATANSLNGLTFDKNSISSLGTTAATTAIKFGAAADRVSIRDNFGVWAILNDTAAMVAAGAHDLTNFDFGRNRLTRPNTSSTGGSFISSTSSASTGHCYDNYMYQLDNTAGIWIATGTGLSFTNNYSPITGAADKSALINPAAV